MGRTRYSSQRIESSSKLFRSRALFGQDADGKSGKYGQEHDDGGGVKEKPNRSPKLGLALLRKVIAENDQTSPKK
jgi:hypothetical protein